MEKPSTETPTDVIPKLPNDVIIEILTRLPVKSILKFRCVCRSWFSLISTRQFVKTHLKNIKEDSSFEHHRFLLNCRGNLKQCSVNSLLYEPITYAFDTDYSVNSPGKFIRAVGSCDGMICLIVDRKDLIFWNPTTRISKKLPDFGVKINAGDYFAFACGLGFDKSSDDYKVVGFFKCKRDLSEVIVQVYSLKRDQWKRINDFKGRWVMDDPATFAHGKLYWIANPGYEMESGWYIVSLDLETETYDILQKPDYVKSGNYSRLGECDGCLYVLCGHLTNVEVWKMDDHTVGKETWKKVVTIPFMDDFLKYTYKKILYVLKNGKVMLLCGLTFVIFDPKDCSFTFPKIKILGEFVSVSSYFESLVSPVG